MTASDCDCDLAWAAGLFDGEGTATLCGSRRRLALSMTDEESVRKFCSAIGVGKVYGPYANASMERRDGFVRKPTFLWVAEQANADTAAALLVPLVGSEKRESILALCDVTGYDVKTAVLT